MDIGAFELQIFVSLVVVLGAAFVALVCDYLKGNNEQLREKNIELRVRREEQERRALLDPGSIVPQNFLEQFFAAARHAGLILTNNPAAQKSSAAPVSVATPTAAEQPAPVVEYTAQQDQTAFDTRAEVLSARISATNTEFTEIQSVSERPKRTKPAVREVAAEIMPPAEVAETVVIESKAAPRAPKAAKSTDKEWVRPEVMARVALMANRRAISNTLEATSQQTAAVTETTIEHVSTQPEIVEVVQTQPIAATIVEAAPEVPKVVEETVKTSNVREEIQRLKSQAKARFEAQLVRPLPSEPVAVVAKVEEQQSVTIAAQEEPKGDLVNIWLEAELHRVTQADQSEIITAAEPIAVQAVEEDLQSESYWFEGEKLTSDQSAYLQSEIERVSSLEASMKPADELAPVSILLPEQTVADISLHAELNRLARPKAEPADALLDQIIRASASKDLQSAVPQPVAESDYLLQEASSVQLREPSRLVRPKAAPAISVGSGDSEHDELLYRLLNNSRQAQVQSDELLPEDSILLDERTDLAEVASVLTPEAQSAAPVVTAPLSLPPGMHDRQTLNRVLEMTNPITGVVIACGINDYSKIVSSQTRTQMDDLMQSAVKLIQANIREKDFAARVSDDQWLLVFTGELGNAAQRRIDGVAEKFWDYQLRNLGQTPLTFSTGAVQVEGERLMDAFLAAQERMENTRKGKKGEATRKRVVNG